MVTKTKPKLRSQSAIERRQRIRIAHRILAIWESTGFKDHKYLVQAAVKAHKYLEFEKSNRAAQEDSEHNEQAEP